MCRAKLHGATVNRTELDYEGSIGIDGNLLEAAGMHPYEQVQVLNKANGERFETYIIPAEPGSGEMCLNGPAARLAVPGDTIMVIAYSIVPESDVDGWRPRVVVLGSENEVLEVINDD